MISAVIGTRLPGPGAIYLSQSLKFSRPVKVGDTITARVEILEVLAPRNRIRLGTVCRNQHGEEVLSGEAWVMPSRTAVRYERETAGPRGRPAAAALGVGQPDVVAVERSRRLALRRRGPPPQLRPERSELLRSCVTPRVNGGGLEGGAPRAPLQAM